MKIDELVELLRVRGTRGLAVDIDETLSDSNRHWFDAMFAFARPHGKSYGEIMRDHKFVEDVPEWRTVEARARIHALLHSNEFCANIPVVPGAIEGAWKVHLMARIAAYITARPEAVRQGTLQWLKHRGLPEAPVIMRDEEVDLSAHNDGKNGWKARMLAAAYPFIQAIVDDNAGLTQALRRVNYPGTLFLYGPQWQPVTADAGVVLCPTWNDVVRMVHLRSCSW